MDNKYILRKLEFEVPHAVCKNKCLFCSNYGGRPVEPPVSKEVCHVIIDDFIECGGETLVITGGEPLECPFVFQLMKHTKNSGLSLILYTSGYLIKDMGHGLKDSFSSKQSLHHYFRR